MMIAVEPVDILLVEDTPADVQLTLHVLHKYHITNRIQVVEDGAEALDYLFHSGRYTEIEGMPTVVLLDLKLPKLSGLQVLRTIKSDPRTQRIPVVVLTSSKEDVDIASCYDLGVNSYIVKPVDFEQFAEAIRQVGLYWLMLNQLPPGNPIVVGSKSGVPQRVSEEL